MIDDKVFPPVKSEEDIGRGLKMIGGALPELATDEVEADIDDVTGLDEAYPSGLPGALAAIMRDEPLKALLWAACIGIAIGLMTSK
ncbi:hypothetical protein [Bosea sp. AAP35]|uniref:hypothetical protein n=1 Tax=Bosea sp. AAP35 TaxID=1523417 RepID=UPI0012E20BDB|nr:hypothetical protein [Bosea sp. AAP35]